MIKVDSRKLTPDECRVLADITISARKGTPLESERSVDDIAKSIENLSPSNGFQVLIASDENGNIIGWLYYYVAFRLMDFISGFFPLVRKNSDTEKIALSLIEAAKRDTVERGQSRLEIELVFPSEEHRAHSEKVVEWYTKCGFKFAAEEVHMRTDLRVIELPEIELPQGYVVKNFSEMTYDMLEGPGFRTLKDSKEGLFLSMSHDEQIVTLKYFFSTSKPCIDDASVILERAGDVVGFVITRIGDDGNPDIGPVGLVPEVRGQGLGSYLLVRVLKSLKDSGSTDVYLDTTITNHPAQKLYRKYGFEDVYYKQFYYWSP